MTIKTTTTNGQKLSHLIIPCFVLFVWGWLLYANALNAPFYLDDNVNIVESNVIRIKQLSIKNIKTIINDSVLPNRPVANLSFALNYLVGGEKVVGYHVVNIMIHITTSLFIFLIIQHILATKTNHLKYSDKIIIALLSSLLWLSHPLHTQSVTYIVQRMNSMSAMFILVAFYFYIKGRNSSGPIANKCLYFLSLVSWLLACGSKEISFVLPVLVMVYEWYFNGTGKTPKSLRLWIFVPVILFLAVFFWLYFNGNPFARMLDAYTWRDFSLSERLVTETRVVTHYLSLFFYPDPSRLSLEYDFPISASLISPPVTILAFTLLVTLIMTAVVLYNKNKLLSFVIVWFLLGLIIESTIIPLEIIFEHRTYLPTAFLFLPIVLILFKCIKQKAIRYLVFAVMVLLLSVATIWRNNVWNEPQDFFERSIAFAPNNARAYILYGSAFRGNGDLDSAITQYHKALSLEPTNIYALFNLAMALSEKGFSTAGKKYLAQTLLYNNLINDRAFDEIYGKIYRNLGILHGNDRDFVNAIVYLKKAIALTGGDADVYRNLGYVYNETKDYGNALNFLNKSLAIDNNNSKVHGTIGNIYVLLNRSNDAIFHYNEALRVDPDNSVAQYNLRLVLKKVDSTGKQ